MSLAAGMNVPAPTNSGAVALTVTGGATGSPDVVDFNLTGGSGGNAFKVSSTGVATFGSSATFGGATVGVTMPQGTAPALVANAVNLAPATSVQAAGLTYVFSGTESTAQSFLTVPTASSHSQTISPVTYDDPSLPFSVFDMTRVRFRSNSFCSSAVTSASSLIACDGITWFTFGSATATSYGAVLGNSEFGDPAGLFNKTGSTSGNTYGGMFAGSSSASRNQFGKLTGNVNWAILYRIGSFANTGSTAFPNANSTSAWWGFALSDQHFDAANQSAIGVRFVSTGPDAAFLYFVADGSATTTQTSGVSAATTQRDWVICSIVAGEINFMTNPTTAQIQSCANSSSVCMTAAGSGGCTGAGTVVHSAHVPANTVYLTMAWEVRTDETGAASAVLQAVAYQATGLSR